MRFPTWIWLATGLLVAGCATALSPKRVSGLGPWHRITARIAVVDQARAWQAMLDWQADTPETGRLRITHAASGMIVELRWQDAVIRLRDNRNPEWRRVTMRELTARGILLHPRELAALLLARPPAIFQRRDDRTWLLERHGSRIRIHWDSQRNRLELTDLSHGRRAILIILGHD